MVKKMTRDWEHVANIIKEDTSVGVFDKFREMETKGIVPTRTDLNGIAAALLRLQDTYKLNTTDIANGDLPKVKRTSKLSGKAQKIKTSKLKALDCFHLGTYAYTEGDFYHTMMWMQEALNRLEKDDYETVNKGAILDYLAYATYKQGNVRHAYLLTSEWLAFDPYNERALANKVQYEDLLSGTENQPLEIKNDRPMEKYVGRPEYANYEKLCRGELEPYKYAHRLKCRYTHNNAPGLLLRPMKTEELYLSPYIVQYLDIMSENEMEVMKNISAPLLNRATVFNPVTGVLEYADYRVSKSVFLPTDYAPVVTALDARIKDLTGLDLETAEGLQIVNYGIGGQYEPHYDFARKAEVAKFEDEIGNRISTLIFYMSDVEAGGGTVFTKLGINVTPVRGSAAYWFNLRRSGIGDFRTRHAACPVLSGSKWVMNKWIHERGQEFKRKCAKKPYL